MVISLIAWLIIHIKWIKGQKIESILWSGFFYLFIFLILASLSVWSSSIRELVYIWHCFEGGTAADSAGSKFTPHAITIQMGEVTFHRITLIMFMFLNYNVWQGACFLLPCRTLFKESVHFVKGLLNHFVFFQLPALYLVQKFVKVVRVEAF